MVYLGYPGNHKIVKPTFCDVYFIRQPGTERTKPTLRSWLSNTMDGTTRLLSIKWNVTVTGQKYQ